MGFRAVGEDELPEERFEIIAVVVGDVPEDGLEVAGSGGLVDRVDDLLEAVGDDLVYCAAFLRQVDYLVGTSVIVLAVLLLDKIVHVHQELGRGARAAQHARNDEDHIDETAAERLEVCRARRVAADRERAVQQPRIHRDRGAVVGHRGLVVLVYEMVVEQVEIFVRQLLAVHLLDAVGKQAAVQADEVLLRQLAYERSDILVFDIGIGVVLAARGGVRGVAVVYEELELLAVLAVLGMLLTVEHVALGHGEITLGHERHLDLILYLLDVHAVRDVHAAQHRDEILVGSIAPDGEKGLAHGPFDLFDGEDLALPVTLDDVEFRCSHITVF